MAAGSGNEVVPVCASRCAGSIGEGRSPLPILPQSEATEQSSRELGIPDCDAKSDEEC